MVTTVVNELFDRLIEAFPADRSYSPRDFNMDPMPDSVSDYLTHEMRMRLQQAVPHVGAAQWVEANHQDVRRARASYIEALASRQRIPADEWSEALRKACDAAMRYLVWPSSTLADTVYDGVGEADPDRIYSRLGYFTAYPYFQEVIEAYFEQKSISAIDRDRFEGLVNRIDRQMTSDYGPAEWRKLLRPLLDVLGSVGYDQEIPTDVLSAFLLEKGADEYATRLRKGYGADGFVPADELGDVFRREVEPEPSSSRRRPEREPVEMPNREQGPVPLWKQYEQGSPEDDQVVETSTRASGSSEPLWKQFRKAPENGSGHAANSKPAAKAPDSPLADLERAVLGARGARNRDLFVRHLFSGDRDEYESTLRKLQNVGSWSEASKVIAQEVFLRHQVNIYSDPAVAFTDAAESKYRS